MKITKEIAQAMLQSENELLKATALEAFPELGMKYPTDLEGIYRPYYISAIGEICKFDREEADNHFSTEQRGKEILTLTKLLEFRDAWNKVDGFERQEPKYKYTLTRLAPIKVIRTYPSGVFSFKTEETAELFLETFRTDLEIIKDYL